MALITFMEVVDAAIMTVILGFIFKDIFRSPQPVEYDPLRGGFRAPRQLDLANLKFAMLVTAPAIILHELGHKFVAMVFGLDATFHASYWGLGIGVALKLIGSPIIFFVPAFVSYPGGATNLQNALIAFAGPGVNLLLWLGAALALKKARRLSSRQRVALYLTSKINMFLFIFNMIPIRPFDGGHFFASLFSMV